MNDNKLSEIEIRELALVYAYTKYNEYLQNDDDSRRLAFILKFYKDAVVIIPSAYDTEVS